MKNLSRLLLLATIFYSSVSLGNVKDAVRAATTRYLEEHFLNAAFMFASEDDNIVFGAHGIYNSEGLDLTPDQKMPVASSIAKTMTAVAVLKLQEKNLLSVHDKISKFNNIWKSHKAPRWANKITIHNLLTHTSGLAEYLKEIAINHKLSKEQINETILSFISTQPTTFQPGTKYQYCNTNYVLLGLIIETVSNMKLADFLKQELFDRIGMRSTHLTSLEEWVNIQSAPWNTPYPERYIVIPNTNQRPTFKPIEITYMFTPYANEGVISNVRDLIKWNRALSTGKILSEESYQLMTKRYMPIPNTPPGYQCYIGYGLFITELKNKDIMYHNSGSSVGVRSEIGYIPNKKFYYAILSNTEIPNDVKHQTDMSKLENQLDIIHFREAIINAAITTTDN